MKLLFKQDKSHNWGKSRKSEVQSRKTEVEIC
jgi:hypothetical protein